MEQPSDVQLADQLKEAFDNIDAEISKVIVEQKDVVKFVIISIFCNGHCLLMGVPGLAKTLLIKTISSVLELDFNRIQFTPDLMPSDIIGAEVMDSNRNMKFIKGPIFSNIVLADEINRTPPKTQAALLEAMQEKSVTVAGDHYTLSPPFFVMATQNPIEQEGTYPLPEAQLDRFLFNITLDYPSFEAEKQIVKGSAEANEVIINKIISAEEIIQFQKLVNKVPVPDNVVDYAVSLVSKTRPNTERAHQATNDYLDWGAGPRASQSLIQATKCHGLLNGKYSPDIEDVKAVAKPVLRHRLLKNFKAEAEGKSIDDIIDILL